GRTRALARLFAGWHEPITALLEATDDSAVLRNDVYDLDPLPRWGRGRVTLLGDAAHPCAPTLGQGACQAIEDAVVLGRCLAGLRRPAPAAPPRHHLAVADDRAGRQLAQRRRLLAARLADPPDAAAQAPGAAGPHVPMDVSAPAAAERRATVSFLPDNHTA